MKWLRKAVSAIKNIFRKKKVIAVSKPKEVEKEVRVVIELNKQIRAVKGQIADFKLSAKGIDLIVEFEGFYSRPYKCSANVSTIGIGTIKYPNGLPVSMDDEPCTRKQANTWLLDELSKKEKVLNDFLEKHKIELKQHQYDALMSFAYNLGTGYFKPGTSIGNALIAKSDIRIGDAIMLYNKARVGRFRRLKAIRGLTRRRNAERAMFLDIERNYRG